MKRMVGKLVVRRSESRMTCKFTVLRAVYHFSRMLDSCSDRKRLLHDVDTLAIKHFNRILCGMTDGKNYAVGFNVNFFTVPVFI